MKITTQSDKNGRTEAEVEKSYRELEQKFLEQNRRADERKKSTTKPQNPFHKTTCRHCGVHVEYPSEAEGQVAPCPQCGKDVVLIILPKGGANRERTAMKIPQTHENDLFRTICQYCGAHVEYAPESKGTTILCPHCRKHKVLLRKCIPLIPITAPTPAGMEAKSAYKNTNSPPVNDPPYTLPAGFVSKVAQPEVDRGRASKPKATDENKGGWIATVIGGVICLCIVLWLCPSLYWKDKAVIIGAIDSQPYRITIDNYLRQHANDPSSVEIVSLTPTKPNPNGSRHVSCIFRGKNAFGALVVNDWVFVVDADNNILSAQDYTQ